MSDNVRVVLAAAASLLFLDIHVMFLIARVVLESSPVLPAPSITRCPTLVPLSQIAPRRVIVAIECCVVVAKSTGSALGCRDTRPSPCRDNCLVVITLAGYVVTMTVRYAVVMSTVVMPAGYAIVTNVRYVVVMPSVVISVRRAATPSSDRRNHRPLRRTGDCPAVVMPVQNAVVMAVRPS
ncbi:hypothetical protein RhiJN_14856 [Ceratobasidium sp. AG-Ba]|nr:hypothetical protein RhiJN_14850 [Ceratobasidium sp. AG-Ba]QRV86838.1 hypothetical protein RhiJN_14856 [Ceratobasidium sp. AG-Ba]